MIPRPCQPLFLLPSISISFLPFKGGFDYNTFPENVSTFAPMSSIRSTVSMATVASLDFQTGFGFTRKEFVRKSASTFTSPEFEFEEFEQLPEFEEFVDLAMPLPFEDEELTSQAEMAVSEALPQLDEYGNEGARGDLELEFPEEFQIGFPRMPEDAAIVERILGDYDAMALLGRIHE
jgi:hypothetical protein